MQGTTMVIGESNGVEDVKVFRLNESDWVAAISLEEAIVWYM